MKEIAKNNKTFEDIKHIDENSGITVVDHFPDIRKTIQKPKGAEKTILDYKLTHHLVSVGQTCDELYTSLMENYIENDERLSEKSKNLNQLEWTKLINNYRNMTEEIILNEYIFV